MGAFFAIALEKLLQLLSPIILNWLAKYGLKEIELWIEKKKKEDEAKNATQKFGEAIKKPDETREERKQNEDDFFNH